MKLVRKRETLLFWILLLVSSAFYLAFYIHDGVIMTVDGPTYISMDSDREPFYCIFLWLFRTLCGEETGMKICMILQCIFAGFAVAYFTDGMKKIFKLNWFSITMIVVIQYGLTILNRFIAQRKYSYYNSICTEALAFSVWTIFFIDLLRVLYTKDKSSIIRCLIWSFIGISIRKQMLITLPLLFLVIAFVYWSENKAKAILFAFGVIICSYALVGLFDCTYNYFNRGIFAKHTGDATFILGNEVYVATPEMEKYISDEANRELFKEIMIEADALQYNIKYAPQNLIDIEDHYADVYDRIKFDVNSKVIREYEQDVLGMDDEILRRVDYTERVGSMMRDLLLPTLPGLFKVFMANLVCGFITTVLKVRAVLNELSIVIYIGYIALTIVAIKKRLPAAKFAVITMIAIVINVCFVSAALFTQMRYMIYNTGLFYQAAYLMLAGLLQEKVQTKTKEKM